MLEKGLSLVPLRVYFTHGIAKVEIALARGKRQHEKRQSIAKRDAQREAEQALAGGAGRAAQAVSAPGRILGETTTYGGVLASIRTFAVWEKRAVIPDVTLNAGQTQAPTTSSRSLPSL